MPTIFAGAIDPSLANQGILAPRVGPGSFTGQQADVTPTLPDDQQQLITQRMFNTTYNENRGIPWYRGVAETVAGTGIDLTDTGLSSLYNATPMGMVQNLVGGQKPINRGDIWNLTGRYGGAVGGELQDYYTRNQSRIELLSGLTGAIATGYAAGDLLLPYLADSLASSTAISSSRLWQAGARINSATRAAMESGQAQAAMTGEAYKAWVPLFQTGSAGARNFQLLRIGKGVGKAAFEELAIASTMNTNRAIYSDDMSENIFYSAIGLGVGGAVAGYGAKYAMRELANDPTQIMRRRDAIDPQGLYAMQELTPAGRILGAEAKESAELTANLLIARQVTQPNAVPELASRFETIRATGLEAAGISAQKISTKGITGVPGTRFNIESTPGSAGAHFIEAGKNDPLNHFGLDSVGVMRVPDPTDVHAPGFQIFVDREAKTEVLRKTQIPTNIQEACRLEQQQALTLYDGQWLPAKTPEAYGISNYVPDSLVMKQTTKGVNEFVFATDSGRNVRINADFNPKIGVGGKIAIESMPHHDLIQIAQDGMTSLMKRMKATGEVHVVPQNPNWFQLDSAIEFEKRGGSVQWHNTGDITNAAGAQLASLRLKYLAISNKPIGNIWQRLSYNLPLPNAAERIYDGTGDSIRTVLYGAAQGNDLSQLQSLRQSVMKTSGLDMMESKPTLDGNLFNFNRTEGGKWKAPVVGFFDNSKVSTPLSAPIIAQANAEIKAARVNTMINNPKPGEMIPQMTADLMQRPEFQRSRSVSGLSDDQVTGLGSKRSQLASEFLTGEFTDRDSPLMLDTRAIRTAANQYVDAQIHALTKPLAEIAAKLHAAPAMASKTLTDQLFSNASGWDLKAAVLHGNFIGFELADTGRNATRLGRAVQQGELLVNPRTGAQMVVDQLGMNYVNAFNQVAQTVLADKNRLRVARGLSPIQAKTFYFPPPNTRGARVGWTFDEEGQMVPGGGIVQKDPQTFERLRDEKLKNLPPGWTFKTREQIPTTSDEYDRAAMDFIDPGVGYAPAKGQTGTLANDLVNPHAIGDSMDWVRRQVEQLGTDWMRVTHDSQLGIARARSGVEAAVQGMKPLEAPRNIWNRYQALVLGQNLSDSNNSISGNFMRAGEKIINGQIAAVWPAVAWMAPSHINQWIGDMASRMGVRNPANTLRAKSFAELSQKLGPYSPFQSASDYAEQTFKVNRPPEIKAIAQGMNQLSSALVLRYGELPMAAMNMLGIITTMPSILRAGKAPITSYFQVGDNTRVGVLDTMKILMGAMKDHVSPAKAADWAEMIKNGDTNQTFAHFNQQMSTVTDRSSFNRVFMGDKTGAPAKNVLQIRGLQDMKDIAKYKGIDGLLSIATDTTEGWSRTWAHFAGLRLADMQGITGMQARHGFAREIANAAIANYNPMNRPELYQSAFGSMYGLFSSYMQAYNQRLFRWMETGDYKSIGSQMLMQSSLFGVASMPGFNLVQAGLMHAGVLKGENGEDATLMDHIYAKLGPEIGSAFAHGGLSELGAALYTRGDMNYRDVTLNPASLMAGVGVMTSVVSGVKEAAQSLFSQATDSQSLESNAHMLEVLARNMPNRVLKGILTQFANGGLDTDSRGQIVSENKNFFEAALRMFGVRSTRQQGEIEAFYANKQLMQREAARMDDLRIETRSMIRNDPNWQSNVMTVFQRYLDGGGRPEHFRTWIKDQIQSSTRTRDVNDLLKALKHPENQMQIWRYGAYDGGG